MSNGTSILLSDASNNPIHFFSVYDSGPSKFVLLPQQQLQPGQKYTVTFKGGPNAPHITDEAGTPLASDYTLSFTTAPAPQITTSTIFAPADMPDNPMANDQSSVELGLKFRSDKDGLITGVRFYKGGAANGGQHLGRLWTSDGTLLGSVPFANETGSGWQQALFQTPVPITAHTTYVVSYFAPQGNYAADNNDFASSGVDNAPLHALSDAAAGGNGVFLQSLTGGFPTDSSMATNYWYDVAILGETPLTSAQVTMLSDWVTAGGNLIAARPDKQLASLLGITDASYVRSGAYTIHSMGTNGGQVAAFTFDLPRSIGDYVNLDKAAIPQADELRRLLRTIILSMIADSRPLPH